MPFVPGRSAGGLCAACAVVAVALTGGGAAGAEGEDLFVQRCMVCHGNMDAAPTAEALGALDLQAYLAGLEAHRDAGGLVRSLAPEEVRAIHDHLQERAGGSP